jgi:hypothetical protein
MILGQQVAAAMPDTSAYYHAAYLAAAVLYGGYVLSLWIRARGVRERLQSVARGRGESQR